MPTDGSPAGVSRFATVLGQPMHYLEAGAGSPIVFLHGNPTSSYLWRNVIPHVAGHGRCLAPDLIGMGRSGKPATAYRLVDHIAAIEAFLDALDLHDITFVLHDWGVAIGVQLLARHPERFRAVAFMEGHLHPVDSATDFDDGARAMFARLRSDDLGRRLILAENLFIEQVLPSGVLRDLTAEEMDAYRAPFLKVEERDAIWRWVQEIPIDGHPADVAHLLLANRVTLIDSPVPKLLFIAHPGAVIREAEAAWCRESLPRLTVVDLGDGIHFLPEDHAPAIGRAVARWLTETVTASA